MTPVPFDLPAVLEKQNQLYPRRSDTSGVPLLEVSSRSTWVEINKPEKVEWQEPPWSVVHRRETLYSIFFNRDVARIFALITLVALACIVVLMFSGKIGQTQIRTVIVAVIVVVIALILIGILQLILQYVGPPMSVLIYDRQIHFGGKLVYSAEAGDVATIETDAEGHRWLIINHETISIRIGIADEVEVDKVERRL